MGTFLKLLLIKTLLCLKTKPTTNQLPKLAFISNCMTEAKNKTNKNFNANIFNADYVNASWTLKKKTQIAVL